MVFIGGVLLGNIFGMFLMSLFVVAARADDEQSANEQRNPGTSQSIRSHPSKFIQETDIC
jgi:hypothetical protein